MLKFIKLLVVILGSILVGLGISIAVNSGLGSDPLSLMWDGMSKVLSITIGQASLIVSGVMLITVLILDRKKINVGTIVNPIVTSYSTDFFIRYSVNSDSFIIKLLLLLSGLVILAFGLALYSTANFGQGAYEALVLSIVDKLKVKFVYVRYFFDFSFLIIAILLGGKLSIGPIIALLTIGYLIQTFMEIFKNNSLFCKVSEA